MSKPKIILFYLTNYTEWIFNVHQSILNLQGETYNTWLSIHTWKIYHKFAMLQKIGTFPIACYRQIPCREFRSIDWTNHLDWLGDFYSKSSGDFGLGNYDPRQIDMVREYCDQHDIPYLTMCFHWTEQEFPAIVRHVAECQIYRVDNFLTWRHLEWRDILWKFLPADTRLEKYKQYYSTVIPSSVVPRDTDVKVDFAKLLDQTAMEQFVQDIGFPEVAPNTQAFYDQWRTANIDFYR